MGLVRSGVLLALAGALAAADFRPPAGTRPVARRPGAETVLPGGRIITPYGRQFLTGSGPFGIAVSPSGSTVATADSGPGSCSVTVLRKDSGGRWRAARHDVPAATEKDSPDACVHMGLAFGSDRELYVSEGNSGRVRLIDPRSGSRKRVFDLNGSGFRDSYTAAMAIDRDRGLLWVVDQANFRIAGIDLKTGRVIGSAPVGRLPFAIALSPGGMKAYVANLGMFSYQPVSGADPEDARDTGLPFPAFGFPSLDALVGAQRATARGPVNVPGLGNPNARESNSVAIVDLADPARPRATAFVRTGLPFGPESRGGSSPSAVAATPEFVFVANAHNDSITVLDARTGRVRTTVPIRIPGLENRRGVLPVGLAWDEAGRRLLVAEAGINAVSVIDAETMKVTGHIPAGWFPAQIAVSGGTVYVANAKGHGTGPNSVRPRASGSPLRRGSLSVFEMPPAEELEKLTSVVMENNGFIAAPGSAPLPEGIRRVVVIVKEGRTFDEVLGDVESASNGTVRAGPALARYGRRGRVDSSHRGLRRRPPVGDVDVTPNHHAIARRWAFSDNFYADSEEMSGGHHWLAGVYPNAWTESSSMAAGSGGGKDFRMPGRAPGRAHFAGNGASLLPEEQIEAGSLWHHLERNGVSFLNFGGGMQLAGAVGGEGLKPTGARYLTNVPMPNPLFRNTSREYPQFNLNIPDQYRASRFIAECERRYGKGGEPFPRFVFIHLPNDHTGENRPDAGYPYDASFVADNDYALGRILAYLSNTPWWRDMAVFIAESNASGGVDHIDSHRTVLLVAGPYARRDYVSRVNASFPALLKTVFRLLGVSPLNLFDAAAADLSDCFTAEPDFTPYEAVEPDVRIFDPAAARDPLDPVQQPQAGEPAPPGGPGRVR
jgi:YVTN family beta-propeller protein